jgi:hypothetical protein
MYIDREFCIESEELSMISNESFKTAGMHVKSYNIRA